MGTKVLILAGDTDDNLGDLAIVCATCDLLRSIDPAIEIALVTSRPDRDRSRMGIDAIPRGRQGIMKLLAAARAADLVICGGGGLFQDDDSVAKMPYWALRLALVRAVSGPIVGLAIGAGPLDRRISLFFAKLALRQMQTVSVRDGLAQAVLQPLTDKAVDVVPDPAFMLSSAGNDRGIDILRAAGVPMDGSPLIGVAVRRLFYNNSNLIPYKLAAKIRLRKNRGKAEMSIYVRLVAAALDQLIAASNAHVVFLPTYNAPQESDYIVCNQVAEKMRYANFSSLVLDDPYNYLAVSGHLSVMLAGRMHAAILAAATSTPVVGLAYNQKFAGTFSLLGQEQRCLSVFELVNDQNSERLSTILTETVRNVAKFRPDSVALQNRTRYYIKQKLSPFTAVATANAPSDRRRPQD